MEVSVILDCKIHMPDMGQPIVDAVTQDIDQELKKISQQLSDRAAKIIKTRSKFKVYSGG